MDGLQLSQGYKGTVYFLPLNLQDFLVVSVSTSEGWKAKQSTWEPPSGSEPGVPGSEIQHLNQYAIVNPLFLGISAIGSFSVIKI